MTSEDRHEERVRDAVVAALERIEGPDRGRLARIERELLARRARRRRGPHWWWAIVGLGLAAGAGAAWWGLQSAPEEPPAAVDTAREEQADEPRHGTDSGTDGGQRRDSEGGCRPRG